MANEPKFGGTRLVLTDRSGLGRIHVETEAFFEFSFWLAEELEDLVAQWRHVAPREPARFTRSKLRTPP